MSSHRDQSISDSAASSARRRASARIVCQGRPKNFATLITNVKIFIHVSCDSWNNGIVKDAHGIVKAAHIAQPYASSTYLGGIKASCIRHKITAATKPPSDSNLSKIVML